MGGGHDGAARELRRRLAEVGHQVHVVDFLTLAELRIGWLLMAIYRFQLRVAPWSYQLTYRLSWLLRRPMTALDMWLTRRKLSRAIRHCRPDVIVSVYPLSSVVLGRMRRKRLLRVPVVTYLTDFSVHPMWVDRGVDHHLAVSDASVQLAAKRGARDAVATAPLVGPAFAASPVDRREVRTRLGLSEVDRAVLVVAGSWGAGDVADTVRSIAGGGEFHPVVVCGRNAELHAELTALGAGTVIGWTDEMASLMVAVDAVVENAGGLTCMEAFAAGVPVVTYLPIPGHGRDNAATMAGAGVSLYARDAQELHAALRTVTDPGATREALVRRAAALFVGDAAGEIARVAETMSLGRRRHVAPIGLRPMTRIAAALLLCVASYWAVALGGAEMSAHGIGVAEVPAASRRSTAYLGVLVDDSELDDPSSLIALGSRGASIVVDASIVDGDPAELTALARANVDVVNGGCGCRSRLRNRRAEEDLAAEEVISARLGRRVTAFASARLDGFDYFYATRAHERLVRPDRVLTMRERGARLAPGRIYLLDGRGVPAATLVRAVDALVQDTALTGVDVTPFRSLR
jgi:UDP-N-acetylglucosamine:LPS N-acetylglucosamine transferase